MSQDLPITIKRGFVDRSWGQVHYRTAGSGPALVLSHKTYYSSRSFLRVMPLLAPYFRVIVPDTPGQGESDNPPSQWSIPQYASALFGVLDVLGVDEFYLVGNSTGAAIACEAAVICPTRIKKLVLFGMPRWKDEAARQALRRLPLFYGPLEVKDEGIEAVLRYDEASRLPLLKIPTLLMWADGDTMFTPFIEDTTRLVPHATTKVLHSSPLMYLRDPEPYAATLLEYLQS
jgi:pimeloyl-ACP methyl ester carboxylesterase